MPHLDPPKQCNAWRRREVHATCWPPVLVLSPHSQKGRQ